MTFNSNVAGPDVDLPLGKCVRIGAKSATVLVHIQTKNDPVDPHGTEVLKSGRLEGRSRSGRAVIGSYAFRQTPDATPLPDVAQTLFGDRDDALLAPPVLLFHAFRRLRSGPVALNSLMQSGASTSLPSFKRVVVKQLLTRSGLIEGGDATEAEKVFDQLDLLVRTYGNGRLGRLAAGSDGALDLRIEPLKGGPSVSFDGLSSGQKEVITTFFLIWYATRDCPSLVLVDEPELHLNAEWQRPWVRTLTELAPWNQYILATHSEEVFASVPSARRIILRGD